MDTRTPREDLIAALTNALPEALKPLMRKVTDLSEVPTNQLHDELCRRAEAEMISETWSRTPE